MSVSSLHIFQAICELQPLRAISQSDYKHIVLTIKEQANIKRVFLISDEISVSIF